MHTFTEPYITHRRCPLLQGNKLAQGHLDTKELGGAGDRLFTRHASHDHRHGNREATDLLAAGVEEVSESDDVTVVQLPHDLQLPVLVENNGETRRGVTDDNSSWTVVTSWRDTQPQLG